MQQTKLPHGVNAANAASADVVNQKIYFKTLVIVYFTLINDNQSESTHIHLKNYKKKKHTR